ncbi:MAG: hypothetical protein L0229_20440 [Blastocatellia bacterium]|nr:hypothetical protein [Blastocatellia bacterium]
MQESDFERFGHAMYALGEVFGKDMTGNLIELYFKALSDLSVEEFERAANLAIGECKFFPKPVELRERLTGTASDMAAAAWECAISAYRKAGYWQSVIFVDPHIGAAIVSAFGGWVGFSESLYVLSDEMIRAKQKEFEAAYRNARREGRKVQHLPGHHETTNRNTVSTWTRDKFGPVYSQPVYIANGASGHFVSATFDRSNAQLIDSVQGLLEAATVKAISPVVRKELRSAPDEVLHPEEGREILSEAVSGLALVRRMPDERRPMTAEETAERIRTLRQQAELLQEEECEPIPF